MGWKRGLILDSSCPYGLGLSPEERPRGKASNVAFDSGAGVDACAGHCESRVWSFDAHKPSLVTDGCALQVSCSDARAPSGKKGVARRRNHECHRRWRSAAGDLWLYGCGLQQDAEKEAVVSGVVLPLLAPATVGAAYEKPLRT